ncbi:hypothetical protein [Actinocrispum wychmicini]|nr:hypothetical protein [Actinocrispum wychmicini]
MTYSENAYQRAAEVAASRIAAIAAHLRRATEELLITRIPHRG